MIYLQAPTTCIGNTVCLVFLGTNVVTFLFFWLFGGFYLFMDLTGRPKWALQYKIQDGTNQPVSYKIQTSKHLGCFYARR